MVGKYVVSTLGCKVNQYESEQIRDVLEGLGFVRAAAEEIPDVAVVNTCAVTNAALAKSRQTVRRLTRDPRTHILVVGCAATDDPKPFRTIAGVCKVLGHDSNTLEEIRSYVLQTFSSPTALTIRTPHEETADTTRQSDRREATPRSSAASAAEFCSRTTHNAAVGNTILPRTIPLVKSQDQLADRIDAFRGRQRALLKVQDGCDAWCTYCIIPRLRPVPRSKPIDVVVREAATLVANGHKEIVVTGIFLGAYGQQTAIRKRFGQSLSPLVRLVDALANVRGLERLRLSSLEPGDVSDELIDVIASHAACVPHLHLPLQSGSPAILRHMNRQYGQRDFLRMIDRVRTRLDRPAVSTDIIVGFPGESEAAFSDTLRIAQEAQFLKIHAFPFSPRQRTAAARWTDDFVERKVVRRRMQALASLEKESSLTFRRALLGTTERVMVEQITKPWDDHQPPLCCGRADRYFEVHVECNSAAVGDLLPVRLDRVTATRTHGSLHNADTDRVPLTVLDLAHG